MSERPPKERGRQVEGGDAVRASPAPKVTSFKVALLSGAAAPDDSVQVEPGDRIILSWEVEGAEEVEINCGIGRLPASPARKKLTVQSNQVWSLRALAKGGAASAPSVVYVHTHRDSPLRVFSQHAVVAASATAPTIGVTLRQAVCHFRLGSPIVLPEQPWDLEGAGAPGFPAADFGADTFVACARILAAAAANPDFAIAIAGHTDQLPEHAKGGNFALSEDRSAGATGVLLGDRNGFVQSAADPNYHESADPTHAYAARESFFPKDVAQILDWVNRRKPSWNCGADQQVGDQVLQFKRGYNGEFGGALDAGTTEVREDSWGAIFDLYQQALKEALASVAVAADFAAVQLRARSVQYPKLQPGNPLFNLGCSWFRPMQPQPGGGYIRPLTANRRVDVFLIRPNELPQLPCHPAKGVCAITEADPGTPVCDLYGGLFRGIDPGDFATWTLTWDRAKVRADQPARMQLAAEGADGQAVTFTLNDVNGSPLQTFAGTVQNGIASAQVPGFKQFAPGNPPPGAATFTFNVAGGTRNAGPSPQLVVAFQLDTQLDLTLVWQDGPPVSAEPFTLKDAALAKLAQTTDAEGQARLRSVAQGHFSLSLDRFGAKSQVSGTADGVGRKRLIIPLDSPSVNIVLQLEWSDGSAASNQTIELTDRRGSVFPKAGGPAVRTDDSGRQRFSLASGRFSVRLLSGTAPRPSGAGIAPSTAPQPNVVVVVLDQPTPRTSVQLTLLWAGSPPMPAASQAFTLRESTGAFTHTGLSDKDGKALVAAVAPGAVVVALQADPARTRTATIPVGQNPAPITVTFQPPTASVEVTLLWRDESPVQDAPFTLRDALGGVHKGRTDAQGQAAGARRLTGVASGPATISLDANPAIRGSGPVPPRPDPAALVVLLNRPAPRVAIDLTVRWRDGPPVRELPIALTDSSGRTRSAATDAKGRARIPGVMPGPARIVLQADPGRRPQAVWASPQPVMPAAPNPAAITVALDADEPRAGFVLALRWRAGEAVERRPFDLTDNEGRVFSAWTNEQGEAEVGPLALGAFRVELQKPTGARGSGSARAGRSYEFVYLDKAWPAVALKLTLLWNDEPPTKAADVLFTLSDSSAAPITSDSTDGNGAATVFGVMPGMVSVKVAMAPGLFARGTGQVPAANPAQLTITLDQQPPEPVEASWSTGRVKLGETAKMIFTAPGLVAGSTPVTFEVTQDGSGIVDQTTVLATAAGRAEADWSSWFDPAAVRSPVQLDGDAGNNFAPATFSFTASAGDHRAETRKSLTYADWLRVRLIDDSGVPYSRTKALVLTPWGTLSRTTDDNGVLEVDGLPPGGEQVTLADAEGLSIKTRGNGGG